MLPSNRRGGRCCLVVGGPSQVGHIWQFDCQLHSVRVITPLKNCLMYKVQVQVVRTCSVDGRGNT